MEPKHGQLSLRARAIFPPSESPDPADIAVDSTPTAITLESLASHLRSTASLALSAVDDACNLRDVHLAYACLEELLAPVSLEEREEVITTRGELCALLTLVNEALCRRIEAVEAAVDSAHEAVNWGHAQCVALGAGERSTRSESLGSVSDAGQGSAKH